MPTDKLVLCIEDDPVNRLVVGEMLLLCGALNVAMAENGTQGVAMARALKPALVLLDFQLPDINGLEVLDAVRSDPQTWPLQVVLVSANASPADVVKAKFN